VPKTERAVRDAASFGGCVMDCRNTQQQCNAMHVNVATDKKNESRLVTGAQWWRV